MEASKIAKKASTLNAITVIGTILMFILLKLIGTAAKNANSLDEFANLLMFQNIVRLIVGLFAATLIVLTIILMTKNNKQVNGLGLLLAANIILLVFAVIGMMAGIVIYILCAISINKINQQKERAVFQPPVNEEINTLNNFDTTDEPVE